MRARRNENPSFRFDARLFQRFDFFDEDGGINDDAVANQTSIAWIKNSRWYEMNFERAQIVDDGVSRIVAAVKACGKIEIAREVIDGFAFALIAPLRAENNCDRHVTSDKLISQSGNRAIR